ncbi:MAG: ADP-ribosylglycohydrolase family protein [Bacteroidota bacterium]
MDAPVIAKNASSSVSLASRFRGCLLGGAVGDALGAPVEFMDIDTIRSTYGEAGIADFDEAYGRTGAITDDTQMTLFTAEGLLCANNRWRETGVCNVTAAVRRAYLRWYNTQQLAATDAPFTDGMNGRLVLEKGLFERRGPGTTCLTALGMPTPGEIDRPINDSKGCGGVMRVAPVGLIAAPDRAFALGCETAAITHSHPSGYLAAGAMALLVALLREGATLASALDTVEEALERFQAPGHIVRAGRPQDECLDAIRTARSRAELGDASPEAIEQLGAGWVAEEALAIGIYCAIVAGEDFRTGVALAVNHSGDSDSTGAIAGSLLGISVGENGIPEPWRRDVELADLIREMADDLYAAYRGVPLPRSKYPA